MIRKTMTTAIMLATLALSAQSGFAQDRGRDRAQVDRDQQVDRDRTFDRDRLQDRDRIDVPSQDRDRDRDQDRTNVPDFARLSDQDIYGSELMTARERNRYRRELSDTQSDEERERVRAEHQAEVQQRAHAQGVTLAPTSEGPIYGENLMTLQERIQYREQLRLHESERAQFMAQHQERMQARAETRGVTLEE